MGKKCLAVVSALAFFGMVCAGCAKESGRIIHRQKTSRVTSRVVSPLTTNNGANSVQVNLKFAHNQTALDNPYVYGASAFKEKLGQLSGGTMQATLYNGTMSEDEGTLLKYLQDGTADIVVISPGLITGLGVPEVDIFSLSYLFDNFAHWGNVLDGEFGSELANIVSKKTDAVRILGYWSAGVRDYYGKKPIREPADLEGMTIRIGNSPVQQQFWKSCGAIPKSVGWGDLYNALNEGSVDSAENDYTNFSLKEHHKTKNGHYVCETEHDFTTRLMLVRPAFYNSLSAEQKQYLEQAAKYATQIERQKTFEQASSSKANVIADGAEIVENKDIDIEAFKKLAHPIQDEYAQKNNMERFIKMVRDVR